MGENNKGRIIQCEYPNGIIRCCVVDEEIHEKLQEEDIIAEAGDISHLGIQQKSGTNEIPSPVAETSDMQYIEQTYCFENIIYNVCETRAIHQQLANDPVFYAEYFKDQLNTMEVVRIQDESSDNNKSTEIENFKWDRSSTKLLLDSYSERIHKFRDPKMKKKMLWAEIKREFEKNGYEAIAADIFDGKLRNMKKTYRTIKYNNGKSATGRGRISWEWFDQFENIFKEDKTVNFGHLVKSMNETTKTLQQPSSLGKQSLEETLTEGQSPCELHFYLKPLLSTMQPSNRKSSQHILVRFSVQSRYVSEGHLSEPLYFLSIL